MHDSTKPKQDVSTTSTELKSLRLPANYGATLGVKKLLTLVTVGKPKKQNFFRTHSVELLEPEFRKTAAFGKTAQDALKIKVVELVEKRML
jgi:hypothetical protein